MRLVYFVLGWVAGISLSATYPFASESWLGLVLVSFFLAWFFWKTPRVRIVALVIVFFSLGGLRYSIISQSSDLSQFNDQTGVTVEGVVVTHPEIRDDRVQFQLDVTSVFALNQTQSTEGLILIQAPPTITVRQGDIIQATGLMTTPARYDAFSYTDYLARQNVFSLMRNASIEIIQENTETSFSSILFDLRQRAQEHIEQALPEPQAALLVGILLGNENGIDPQLREDFQATGTSHIIAISGFNMVIISGIIVTMMQRMTQRRWLIVFVAIGFVLLYTIFVGGDAAVFRAAIMSGLLVIAPLLRRKTYVPASLAFVTILLSAIQPTVLWEVSFQLSFFAVLGLILFGEPLGNFLDKLIRFFFPSSIAQKLSEFLQEPIAFTVAATIGTFLLSALYFQQISIIALLVNLLIVPVQALLLIVGGIATIFSFFVPPLAQILYWLDLVLLSWSISIVRLFADFDFAKTSIYLDSEFVWLFYVVLLGGTILMDTRPAWSIRIAHTLRKGFVFWSVLVAGVGILILTLGIVRSRPDGNLHLWFLDVGHSNAVLLQSPGGAQVLIDGGRFPSRLLTSLGDRMPFYDREIDVLILTHPDQFDLGALPTVLSRYNVGIALTNGQANQTAIYEDIATALADYPTQAVYAGYTLDFDDGLQIEVLHPQENAEQSNQLNDQAMILRVTFGERSFLLTSDANQEAQVSLLETGQFPLADVMQIPQHGTRSALTGEFLETVQPQLVVLQGDKINPRGDPAFDTMTLMEDIPLYRTDEEGAIHLWTDGIDLWFQPNS